MTRAMRQRATLAAALFVRRDHVGDRDIPSMHAEPLDVDRNLIDEDDDDRDPDDDDPDEEDGDDQDDDE